MLAGLMILPFTVKPGAYIKMIRENRKVFIWVMVLQTVINYSLFYFGMDLVPGALGAVIVGSQPLTACSRSHSNRISCGTDITVARSQLPAM
jgi:drug/metabolite transporter (DMT)-like permease